MRRACVATLSLCALAAAPAAHAHDGRVPAVTAAAPKTLAPPPPAARGATAWCGDERATDDARNELDRRSHRFHAVYALAADAPSRLRQVAPRLQADADAASGLLAARHGRGIRFDRGTRCGRQFLDITTVRLPLTGAQLERLAETPDGVLDALARHLDRAGLRTARDGLVPTGVAARTNYLVWVDGATPTSTCGQATVSLDRRRSPANDNNAGGKVAAVFRSGDGFCGPATVLHEIAHTLGAVQPRGGVEGWTGHCDDSANDLMCDVAPDAAADPSTLEIDAGHDDYWDPPQGAPLPRWALNLSRFVCPDATCRPARAARRGAPRS